MSTSRITSASFSSYPIPRIAFFVVSRNSSIGTRVALARAPDRTARAVLVIFRVGIVVVIAREVIARVVVAVVIMTAYGVRISSSRLASTCVASPVSRRRRRHPRHDPSMYFDSKRHPTPPVGTRWGVMTLAKCTRFFGIGTVLDNDFCLDF